MDKLTKLLFLLLCFSSGCNQKRDYIFKEKIYLTGFEVKSKDILNPGNILVYDSLLIIKEPPKTNKSIKILNLHDFSLISNAVWLGKGPGEMVNPASIVIDAETGLLWYSDWGKYEIFKFPIDSLIKNPDFRATESFKIKRGLMPMMNVFYNPNGYFGFSSFNLRKNIVSYIDKNGEQIDSLAIPNKINPDLWKNKGLSDNSLLLHYNTYHNKLVVAGRHDNFIAIIDEKGNSIFELKIAKAKSESSMGKQPFGQYHYFYQIQSDKKFIYCLYSGRVIQVYDKETKRPKMYYPRKLLIFDWTGAGKYEVNLSHELMFFTLDSERDRLIGNTPVFENGLIIFDLSLLKMK